MEKLVPHGSGKVTFPPGSSKKYYEGEWVMGQISGYGQMEYSNGTLYNGQFVNGKKDGSGRFVFENRTFYKGQWKNGKQNGYGEMYSEQGKATKYGKWVDGKLDR